MRWPSSPSSGTSSEPSTSYGTAPASPSTSYGTAPASPSTSCETTPPSPSTSCETTPPSPSTSCGTTPTGALRNLVRRSRPTGNGWHASRGSWASACLTRPHRRRLVRHRRSSTKAKLRSPARPRASVNPGRGGRRRGRRLRSRPT
ncbi:MAG: hypothetical protein F4Y05_01240 [Acidimicrobiaceae bacterium]|nr:hypothetical protein [Acidimicrobiaceae bacterium]MYE08211.1 hypothetical protein [Acidimicrobiaceae bacterium]